MNRDLQNRKTLQKPIRVVLFDWDNTPFDLVAAQMDACSAVVHRTGEDTGGTLVSYFLRDIHGFEDPCKHSRLAE